MNIDITHIAGLARLKFSQEECERLEKDMQDIIGMVEGLPEFTEECGEIAEPMILREDKAETGKFSREELLANAGQVHSGCFSVPKTV